MRLVQRHVIALLCVLAPTACATAEAASGEKRVRIPHADGSGTETIIDVEPSIPGVSDFLRSTPAPIPRPGEIVVPPSETPSHSPEPTPTPRNHW